MSDIDPFAVPPLIAWENCITLDEIKSTAQRYSELLDVTPKWRFMRRAELQTCLGVFLGLYRYIRIKQNDVIKY